jgi:hypothetical protein
MCIQYIVLLYNKNTTYSVERLWNRSKRKHSIGIFSFAVIFAPSSFSPQAKRIFAQEYVSSSRTALNKFPAKAGNLLAPSFVLSPRSHSTSRGPLYNGAKIVISRIFRGFIPRKMLFASRARRDPSSRDSFVMAKPSQTKLFEKFSLTVTPVFGRV